MRFEDSPDLFGRGSGGSTCGETTCDFCGVTHNKGIGYEDDDNCEGGLYVGETMFAGKFVCDCCYERIENEILLRMPDILKWYAKIVTARKERLRADESLLKSIEAAGGTE